MREGRFGAAAVRHAIENLDDAIAACQLGITFASLGLGSFGVYFGRVLRWNSWDVFVRPGSLAAHLAQALVDPLAHPRPIGITLLFTCFLVAGYLLFYSLARATSLLGE